MRQDYALAFLESMKKFPAIEKATESLIQECISFRNFSEESGLIVELREAMKKFKDKAYAQRD